MDKWVYLIIGGIVGTVSRYGLTEVVAHRMGTAFPWGTLAVNLAGCLVIGFLDVVFEKKFLMVHHYRLLLMTGFCGAFTTFSALILETSDFLKGNQWMLALVYVFISVLAGLVCFKLGAVIAELI